MEPLKKSWEAAVHRYALLSGMVEPSEVVAWADAWIWRLDEVPDALVEVSLGGSHLNELLPALGQLAEQPMSSEAASLLFGLFALHLAQRPEEIRAVTSLLERLAIEQALPDHLSAEAYRSDDAQCLAEERMFDPTEVRRDILAFLHRHGARPASPDLL
jgi:hypothetical protein